MLDLDHDCATSKFIDNANVLFEENYERECINETDTMVVALMDMAKNFKEDKKLKDEEVQKIFEFTNINYGEDGWSNPK